MTDIKTKIRNKNMYVDKNFIYNLCAIFLIVFFIIRDWSELDVLAVFGDEFGYWGNAAILLGYDWGELLSHNMFYSIGYSLVLMPLLVVFNNSAMMYHAAIIINVAMVIGIYFCALYITKKISQNSDLIKVCIALLSTLGTSTIFQARIAWSEICLSFLMWISVVLLYTTLQNFRVYKMLLNILVLGLMILVHQKAIPVVLIQIMILLFALFYKKIDYKKILFTVVVFGICYVACEYIEDFHVLQIYSNLESAGTNDVGINSGTITMFITSLLTDFPSIMISLIEKLVVANMSTLFTLFVVWILFFHNILKKEKRIEEFAIISFIAISSVAMIGLTAIRMYGLSRADLDVYSRYFDFVLGPVCVVGLSCLFEKNKQYRYYFSIGGIVSVFLVNFIVGRIYSAETSFNYICSPVIGGIIKFCQVYMGTTDRGIVEKVMSLVIVVIMLLMTICIKNKEKKYLIAILSIVLIWINFLTANYGSLQVNEYRSYFRTPVSEIVEHVDNSEADIYFVNNLNNNNAYSVLKELQFVLMDKGISSINLNEVKNIQEKGEVWIISEGEISMIDKTKLVMVNETFNLFMYYIE